MSEWKASIGRITIFSVPPFSSPMPSALELFRIVWGGDPDNFQKQANPLVPSVAQGKRANLMAACIVQPARIDFSLTPPSPPLNPATQVSYPLIEDVTRFYGELLRVTDVIGQQTVSGSVVRVGANVQFLNLNPNFADANKELSKVIPEKYGVRISDEEDFVFQINCPYQSREVGTFRMNSVTKWSVDRVGVLTFALPMRGPGAVVPTTAPAQSQTQMFIAASVVFDNNNVQTGAILSNRQQSLLLREALTVFSHTQQCVNLNTEASRC
jgi:hypothetical protein